MLELPLHTAIRLGMGHRPVAGGATTRRGAALPACLLAPPCGIRGAMFSGARRGGQWQLRVYDAGTPSRPYGVNV